MRRLVIAEIKKAFSNSKRRIAFFCAVIICILFPYFQKTSNEVYVPIEDEKEFYFNLLNEVGYEYSDAKREILHEKVREKEARENEYTAVSLDFISGTATESDMEVARGKLLYTVQQANVLNYLNMQLSYAKENPQLRQTIYQNGWIEFINRIGIDWLVIICICIFALPIYTMDYESSMYVLTNTCVLGKTTIFYAKTIAMTVISLLFLLFKYCSQICYVAIKYGLPKGHMQIQTVSLLGQNPNRILLSATVIEAFLIYAAGYVLMIALFVMIMSVAGNEYFAIAVEGVIYAIFYYIVPKKVCYISGLGMLNPKNYFVGLYDIGDNARLFFSSGEMILIYVSALVISGTMLAIGGKIYAKAN